MTKYLYQQCGINGKCVDFPLVGKFYCRLSKPTTDDTKAADKPQINFTFIPHLDFIDSGKFQFPQNEFNISPLSKKVPKVTPIKISLGAISVTCEYDRDIVASILKDVMVMFVSIYFQNF